MIDYAKTLKDVPLFKGLCAEELNAVLRDAGARVIKKAAGEYILRTGDATSVMGAVISGSVTVEQEDIWGHRNIMNRIPTGDIFAEVFAAVPGSVLNVSVLANEPCEILLVDVSALLALDTKASGRVVRNLVSILARKTMAFNDKITHISKRSTKEKLLSFLSAEAIRRGTPTFEIAYNRQQLADYLCVDRAAMSVELSKLQKEGILSYKKNKFELKEITEP